MSDWLDLDPPPIGLNPTPLFVDDVAPACLAHGPSCPLVYSTCVSSEKPKWVDLFGIDPTYGKGVVEPELWEEQEAELALHVPWCGVHYTEAAVCTENCKGGS